MLIGFRPEPLEKAFTPVGFGICDASSEKSAFSMVVMAMIKNGGTGKSHRDRAL